MIEISGDDVPSSDLDCGELASVDRAVDGHAVDSEQGCRLLDAEKSRTLGAIGRPFAALWSHQSPPQVSEHLRARIASGEFPIGDQLPSMASLMEQYSTSTTVVRMALRELRSSGVVSTRQGKGAFVVALPDDPADAGPSPEFHVVMRRLDQLQDHMRQIEERLAALESAARRPADPADR